MVIRSFADKFRQLYETYLAVSSYYKGVIEEAGQKIAANPASAGIYMDAITEYDRQLKRLTGEYLIDYLSAHGALPSYAFPLFTVELALPVDAHLRLQRDLRVAIKEYAPGSEVVADKRLWRSEGLQFYRDSPQAYQYRLCRNCNHLLVAPEANMMLTETECSICGQKYDNRTLNSSYIKPDGFRASRDSGKPAGQYAHREYGTTQTALLLSTVELQEQIGTLLECGYASNEKGQLFFIYEGEFGSGYFICKKCGTATKDPKKGCKGWYRGAKCTGKPTDFMQVMLGHDQRTDTLHLRFHSTPDVSLSPHDRKFWLTLLYALQRGACRALQIEPRDLNGILYPIRDELGSWQQTIVLFDNVPGGAGYVKDIRENLPAVIEEALRVVNCGECGSDTSCVHCLRDYDNQAYYADLQRGIVIPYLEALIADLSYNDLPDGAVHVVAIDRTRWLLREVAETHHEIWIAADSLVVEVLEEDGSRWLDVLYELLKRGARINLLLRQLPVPNVTDGASLVTTDFLRTLMGIGSGLNLLQIDHLPDWHITIDDMRAIRIEASPLLSNKTGDDGLLTTMTGEGVKRAKAEMLSLQKLGKKVSTDMLRLPPSVRVYEIRRMSQKRERDIEAIATFFERPVHTMYVYDPYLIDDERILQRLRAYIELAYEGGALKSVYVQTRDAQRVGGDRNAQERAFARLQAQFPDVEIEFKRNAAEHDRWLTITRADGTQAQMLIGRGLDFIRADGTVMPTHIVVREV